MQHDLVALCRKYKEPWCTWNRSYGNHELWALLDAGLLHKRVMSEPCGRQGCVCENFLDLPKTHQDLTVNAGLLTQYVLTDAGLEMLADAHSD